VFCEILDALAKTIRVFPMSGWLIFLLILLFSILGGILYTLDRISAQLWDLSNFLRKEREAARLLEIDKRIELEHHFLKAVSRLTGGQ